jgi:hypothetical protein
MDNPFTTTGFEAAGFTFAQPNGVSVRAPLEIWVAAILSVMPEAKQAEVCKRVELINARQLVVQTTDGFPLHFSTLGG